MIDCPACESTQPSLLGILGTLAHCRRTACGMQFSVPASEIEDDEEIAA